MFSQNERRLKGALLFGAPGPPLDPPLTLGPPLDPHLTTTRAVFFSQNSIKQALNIFFGTRVFIRYGQHFLAKFGLVHMCGVLTCTVNMISASNFFYDVKKICGYEGKNYRLKYHMSNTSKKINIQSVRWTKYMLSYYFDPSEVIIH